MKLVKRISIVAVLVFFSMGAAGTLILLHGCADIHLLFSPGKWIHHLHEMIPLLAMTVLFFGALVMLSWLAYFIRHVVRVLRRADDFIREILAGKMPAPLSTRGIRDDEIVTLFSTLNFMRDRQQNLAERLRWQRESEENLRREIEYFDDLQIIAFGRLLTEMRRSAGVVKAYTLIDLARTRKSNSGSPEEQNQDSDKEAMLLSSLKRQARMSRELDFLADVARLERKRWTAPFDDRFDALPLINELTNRCQLALQTRKITLICNYQAGIPEQLACDRELLYQLLHLMVRSMARSLTGGAQVTLFAYGKSGKAAFEIHDRRQDEHREMLAESYQDFRKNYSENTLDPANYSLCMVGLEIVRTIAEKIGCSLDVASDENSATILRMTVPGADPMNTRKMHESALSSPHGNQQQSAVKKEKSSRLLNVYLSDDDKEEAAAFTQIFACENIKISAFPDNTTLLDAAAIYPPIDGAIIAAPFLPGQAAKFISLFRKLTGRHQLPVLVITPVHKRELALELTALPNVWLLESPLNFAQAAELLRQNIE